MKRFLTRTLRYLSFCLLAFILFACIKSYFRADFLSWGRTSAYHLESQRGTVELYREINWLQDSAGNWQVRPPVNWREIDPLNGFPVGKQRPFPDGPKWHSRTIRNFMFAEPYYFDLLGIKYQNARNTGGHPRKSQYLAILRVPYPILLALSAIPSVLGILPFFRRRKATHLYLCPKCRYDLRAQITGEDGDKCPECGTPVPHAPSTFRTDKGTATRTGVERCD